MATVVQSPDDPHRMYVAVLTSFTSLYRYEVSSSAARALPAKSAKAITMPTTAATQCFVFISHLSLVIFE